MKKFDSVLENSVVLEELTAKTKTLRRVKKVSSQKSLRPMRSMGKIKSFRPSRVKVPFEVLAQQAQEGVSSETI